MHSGAPSSAKKALCKLRKGHSIYKFAKNGGHALPGPPFLRPRLSLESSSLGRQYNTCGILYSYTSEGVRSSARARACIK